MMEGGRMNSLPAHQLDFYSAMADFKHMFPDLDSRTIESVLRAHHGVVDRTIDSLLKISLENTPTHRGLVVYPPEMSEKFLLEDLPPSYTEAVMLHRQRGLVSSHTHPPKSQRNLHSAGLSSSGSSSRSSLGVKHGVTSLNHGSNNSVKNNNIVPSHARSSSQPQATFSSFVHHHARSNSMATAYHKWNPPMLGSLPEDFLRIVSVHKKKLRSHSHRCSNCGRHHHKRASASVSSTKATLGSKSDLNSLPVSAIPPARNPSDSLPEIPPRSRRRSSLTTGVSHTYNQILADERLAVALQNQEFLRVLKQDDDFMRTLRRDTSHHSLNTHCRNDVQESFLMPAQARKEAWSPDHHHHHHLPESSFPEAVIPRMKSLQSCDQISIEGYGDDVTKELPAFPHSKTVSADQESVDDDIKTQLKLMGKVSGKKFVDLAKKFFGGRYRKKPSLPNIPFYKGDLPSESTLNLLDSDQESFCEENDLFSPQDCLEEQEEAESPDTPHQALHSLAQPKLNFRDIV